MSVHRPVAATGVRVRSAAIDAVRVIGITAVVAGHIWGATPLRYAIYPWHVPIFLVITGYLWTPGRPLSLELSKRWATLGRPYVVWLAILGAVLAVTLLLSGTLSVGAFGGPLWGGTHATRPFTTFWFVSVLFFTALLYRLVEKLPAWAGMVIALAGLIAAYLHGVSLANTPLAIGLALPCLIFVFAGRGLRIIRTRLPRPAVIGAGLVTLSAVLVITRISAPLDIKPGNFGTPILSALVAVMTSAGVILVAEAVIPRLPSWVARLSMTLAAGGMLVVLTHPAVLWALNTPDHGRTVGFLAALLVPWVVAMLVVRTPLAPWLAGGDRVTAQTNSGG